MKVWLSRNAKRLAALTLALVLVLALAACGSKTQTPETSSTPTVVTPPVQTPADPTSDPARPAGTETDQLTTVLDDIEKNVQLGVTGSSLKAVPYAVKLLDWGAASTMTQSEIKSAVAMTSVPSSMMFWKKNAQALCHCSVPQTNASRSSTTRRSAFPRSDSAASSSVPGGVEHRLRSCAPLVRTMCARSSRPASSAANCARSAMLSTSREQGSA